jgi:type II secretory pathway component PulF
LEDGSSISSAIAFATPHAPHRTLDLVAVAERNGCLNQVLPELLDESDPDQQGEGDSGFLRTYVLMMLIFVPLILGTVGVFMLPKFAQIFRDFKIELPGITKTLFVLRGESTFIVLLVAVIVLLITVGQAFRQLLSSGKPLYNPLRSLFDRVLWYMPVVGPMQRDRGLADACSVIASSLDATHPLDAAIAEAALPHLNGVLNERIIEWSKFVSDGEPLDAAARRAKLPDILCGLIGPAVRSGTLSDTLRFLARHYESSFSRTWYLLRGAAVPSIVLIFGAFVLWVMVGLFAPLIALIQTMSWPRGRIW